MNESSHARSHLSAMSPYTSQDGDLDEEDCTIEVDGAWDSLEAPQPVPAVVHFHLDRATRLADVLAASVYEGRISSGERARALDAELTELEAVIGSTYLDSVGATLGALRRALVALAKPHT